MKSGTRSPGNLSKEMKKIVKLNVKNVITFQQSLDQQTDKKIKKKEAMQQVKL